MIGWARDRRTGCTCAVNIEGRRIRYSFNNYPDVGSGAPIDGWQYEDDLPRLARELDWHRTEPMWLAMDLLRRYTNSGENCPALAAFTAAQREIEEMTLP